MTAEVTKEIGLIRYDFYQKWSRATIHILGDILEWSSYTLLFVGKKDRIAYRMGSSIPLLFPGRNRLSYEFARVKLVNEPELHHKSDVSPLNTGELSPLTRFHHSKLLQYCLHLSICYKRLMMVDLSVSNFERSLTKFYVQIT